FRSPRARAGRVELGGDRVDLAATRVHHTDGDEVDGDPVLDELGVVEEPHDSTHPGRSAARTGRSNIPRRPAPKRSALPHRLALLALPALGRTWRARARAHSGGLGEPFDGRSID